MDCAVWSAAATVLVIMEFNCSIEIVIWPEPEDSAGISGLKSPDILFFGEGKVFSEVEGEELSEGE